MEIRLAHPDELAEVGRQTAEVYVGDGFMPATDAYVHQLADAVRRSEEAELWVAVDEPVSVKGPVKGSVLGSVTFCPVGSSYREIGHADEGEFRMLAVSPETRGRGVGRALVQHCVTRAHDLGYAGVRMSTMDKMTAAHRVYERLGFTRSPADDWSPTPGVLLLAYALTF